MGDQGAHENGGGRGDGHQQDAGGPLPVAPEQEVEGQGQEQIADVADEVERQGNPVQARQFADPVRRGGRVVAHVDAVTYDLGRTHERDKAQVQKPGGSRERLWGGHSDSLESG